MNSNNSYYVNYIIHINDGIITPFNWTNIIVASNAVEHGCWVWLSFRWDSIYSSKFITDQFLICHWCNFVPAMRQIAVAFALVEWTDFPIRRKGVQRDSNPSFVPATQTHPRDYQQAVVHPVWTDALFCWSKNGPNSCHNIGSMILFIAPSSKSNGSRPN